MQSLLERLQEDRILLLDGALGTELARRGFPLDSPLWSAAALITHPHLVEQIHSDYVQAGAEILTANTFRTHRRNLENAGLSDRALDLTIQAVGLAKAAAKAGNHPVWIAGSQAPLEDCYSPADVPDDETLAREHRKMAEHLAAAGADLILVETQNTIREVVAATLAAIQTGLPVLVSFVCDLKGRLLSGESLGEATTAVLPYQPAGILVNCLPAAAVPATLQEIRNLAPDTPVGAYANTGWFDHQKGWIATSMEHPANYAAEAKCWRDAGAKFIGGCCGTTPAHIRELQKTLLPAL